MRMKITCIVLLLAWLFTLVAWFASSHQNALIEARDQHGVRLLSEFHCGLSSIDQGSYLKELRGFQAKHDGYRLLDIYVRDVEQRQEDRATRPK
jgi:hypothetical protein